MANGKEYKTLEELGDDLTGNLQKGEIKELLVNWKWEYEISKEQDIQDTIDGKQIEKYNFEIYIDGGINDTTIKEVILADGVVSGSFICNSDDYNEQIKKLK